MQGKKHKKRQQANSRKNKQKRENKIKTGKNTTKKTSIMLVPKANSMLICT